MQPTKKRDVSQRAAANCEKRAGIESRTGCVLVFSALSGFHVFSPVAWRIHGNSDARSADGNRWKGHLHVRVLSHFVTFPCAWLWRCFFFIRHRDFILEKNVRRRDKRSRWIISKNILPWCKLPFFGVNINCN